MFGEPMQSTNEKVQLRKNDVADWLNGLSLEQYIKNFMENGFTGGCLNKVSLYLIVTK
jgi:hypothetical protein